MIPRQPIPFNAPARTPAGRLIGMLLALALILPVLTGQADTGDAAPQQVLPHYIPLQKHGAYDVEVLVFSRGTSQASDPVETVEWIDTRQAVQLESKPDQWPEWKWSPTENGKGNAQEGRSDSTKPMESSQEKPLVLVDYLRPDLFLKKTEAKLASQPGWHVLLHKKWRLQPSDYQHPTYLNLSTVQVPQPTTNPALTAADNTDFPRGGLLEDLPALTPNPMPPGLVGKLAFSKGRYIHIDAQLQAIQPSENGHQNVANLAEKRRVRSQVLQYFDHPDFGLLVLITPLKAPERSQAAAQTTKQTGETQ